MRRFPILIVLPAVLSGCTVPLKHFDGYRGDGTFTPHAASSSLCQDGYTVDLGAVDLTAATRIDRKLDGLPPIESTIGLAIAPKSSESAHDMPRPSALVTVTLRDDTGHIVLSRQERLSQWTKQYAVDDPQHAFLYRSGALIGVPVGPDVTHVERFPIGEDDSWGTYFTPRRNAHYTLHFAVDEPDADAAALDAWLQVRAVVGCH
jgi:hypothetical protein